MQNQYAIGIDLGGTNLRVALVSAEGAIVDRVKVPTRETVVEALTDSVSQLFREGVIGIGMGVAGLVDRKTGTVSVSPNLNRIEGVDIAGQLTAGFGVPVFIENDANAAALGERWSGAGKDFESFVLLTLGTGIGGGVVHKGKLLDVAAEIGHISTIANGVKCTCGNYGCLESYASARAILGYAITALEHDSKSMLKEFHQGNIYKLTPEDIYMAALEGDNLSRDVLRDTGRYLGVGISNVINIFSPDAVILTGGLIGAWNIFIQEAIKEASKRSFKKLFENVTITPSSLGDDAGILGSAYLAFSRSSS